MNGLNLAHKPDFWVGAYSGFLYILLKYQPQRHRGHGENTPLWSLCLCGETP